MRLRSIKAVSFFKIISDSFFKEWMHNAAFTFQLCLVNSPSDFQHVNVSSLTLFQMVGAKGQQRGSKTFTLQSQSPFSVHSLQLVEEMYFHFAFTRNDTSTTHCRSSERGHFSLRKSGQLTHASLKM